MYLIIYALTTPRVCLLAAAKKNHCLCADCGIYPSVDHFGVESHLVYDMLCCCLDWLLCARVQAMRIYHRPMRVSVSDPQVFLHQARPCRVVLKCCVQRRRFRAMRMLCRLHVCVCVCVLRSGHDRERAPSSQCLRVHHNHLCPRNNYSSLQ